MTEPQSAPLPTAPDTAAPATPGPVSDPAVSAAPATSTPPHPALTVAAGGLALAHLGLVAATGITRLAASTHATIVRLPLPLRSREPAPAEKAPLPYQIVAHSLQWLAGLARHWSLTLPPPSRDGLFHSALNGVVGHTLADLESPLAEGMSLRDDFGGELDLAAWSAAARRGLVVFVHGLCLSDREWQSHEHEGFVRELRELGYGVAWLRYNTGRAVAANGSTLSDLLAALPRQDLPLTLIGHSMGGLVIRAAAYHAEITEQSWVDRLRHAAYLGTPHHGAPLERLGDAANSLLALTPYTRGFMSLGNIRSHGIRDLREGRVVPASKANPYRLTAHARHLLLAGHMGHDARRHFLGDGLVPVRSALGQHVEAHRALHAKDVTRVEFSELNHMQILRDKRVYDTLLQWLRP